MKRLLFRLYRLLCLDILARLLRRRRLTILLYHGVAPTNGHIINYRRKFIAPASFERQIAFLKRTYTILPLDEALRHLAEGTLPLRALAITFDDGYRNNYEYAFPVLKKSAVPATIFLATDFVFDGKPLWVDRLEYLMEHGQGSHEEKIRRDDSLRRKLKSMSDTEKILFLATFEQATGKALTETADTYYAPLTHAMLGEMKKDHITFGAHTQSHPILSMLPLSKIEEEIEGSYTRAQEQCEVVSKTFAYPNGQKGDWTPATERILSKIGFSAALTTISGSNSGKTHRFALRRETMDNTDDWDSFIAAESGFRGIVQSLTSIWRT